MDEILQPWPVRRAEEEAELTMDIDDIDLQALAEEVYELLRRELRLERERQGWREVW
jgi:hypothetical protein